MNNPIYYILFCCLLAITANSIAQDRLLSDEARISLLTITPGDELYSTFGHSAIRVFDPQYKIDIMYNYGTFDFQEPGFYVKFVRGKLNYFLSAYDYKYARSVYLDEQRGIVEQIFNLTPDMREAVYRYLRTNYLPRNRGYKYDFFFDNCATRIRDVFESALGEELKFVYDDSRKLTFRNYIDQYLTQHPISDYGIDLALGRKTDMPAEPREALFLPDYLYQAFDRAIVRIDGEDFPLVSQTDTLLWFPEAMVARSGSRINWPLILLWMLAVAMLVITVFQWFHIEKQHLHKDWIDILLYGYGGMVGLLITFLWFGTDHRVTPENWNLLWAWPSHLMVMGLLIAGARREWFSWYFQLNAAVMGLLLIFWGLLPQKLHAANIALVFTLGVRSAWLSYFYSRDREKNTREASSGKPADNNPAKASAGL